MWQCLIIENKSPFEVPIIIFYLFIVYQSVIQSAIFSWIMLEHIQIYTAGYNLEEL